MKTEPGILVMLPQANEYQEIEFVLKNLPTRKFPSKDSFTCKFHQTFKGEILSNLYKFLQEFEKVCFSTSFLRPALS